MEDKKINIEAVKPPTSDNKLAKANSFALLDTGMKFMEMSKWFDPDSDMPNGQLKLPTMIQRRASGGYLTWGADNLYAQYLINLSQNSAQHNAILTRKTDWICGNGLFSVSKNPEIEAFIKKCNRKYDSLDKLFKKLVYDHETFGGFALLIYFTKGSSAEAPEIAELQYLDIAKLRFNLDADKVKYSLNWNQKQAKAITYDLYDPKNPTGVRLFYYNGSLSREFYPVPTYIGSVTAINTDVEISNYFLSIVKSGFFPSVMINLKNGQPTQEEQAFIERSFAEKFSGSGNAGKFMLSFSDADNPGPEITTIQQPDLDKKFLQVNEAVTSRIIMGHKIPPLLAGLMIAGKLGSTNEYAQQVQQFQNAYVEPIQRALLNFFNDLLSINFPGCDLNILTIKAIGSVFINEDVIASQMYPEEVRANLATWGYIKNADLKPGETSADNTLIGYKSLMKIPLAPPKPDGDSPESSASDGAGTTNPTD